MKNNSDYDRFINRNYHLNLVLYTGYILIISVALIIILNFASSLEIKVITSLLGITLIGLNYTIIDRKKNRLIFEFAEKFEIDLENDFAEFENTIALYKRGEFEKIEAAFTNKKQRRARGFDEKGPTGGIQSSSLDKTNPRIDAMKNTDYDNIIEEITKGESLIEEANEKYAEMSEKRWAKSETQDKDLIEAGVERLGDLVRTDWFDKNVKDDAVRELYDNED